MRWPRLERDQLASSLTSFSDEARIALDTISGRATGLLSPSLRLGVTGLSRAGKTVFITALVHGLLRGGRFPVFESLATGRIARARLAPQPDERDFVAAEIDTDYLLHRAGACLGESLEARRTPEGAIVRIEPNHREPRQVDRRGAR